MPNDSHLYTWVEQEGNGRPMMAESVVEDVPEWGAEWRTE